MRIESYIRNKTAQYIRPLLIKDECEICGKVKKLELHHIQPFAQLLDKCMESLGYKYYKNNKQYTAIELENITNWMLGVQLKTQYITVCESCHEDIHEKIGGFYNTTDKFDEYVIAEKLRKELIEKARIEKVVVPYLDSIVGEAMLTNKDRKDLIKKIDVRSNGKQLKSLDSLNSALRKEGVNFYIDKFSTSRIINNKKKNFNSAWRVLRT